MKAIKVGGRMDTIVCPNCGFEGYPKVEKVNEGTDRDGNRGMEKTYIECPKCEENLKGVI